MQMHMIVTASLLITNSFPKPEINFRHAREVGAAVTERRQQDSFRKECIPGEKKIIKLLRINVKRFIFTFSDSLKVGQTNWPHSFFVFCSIKNFKK